MTKFKSKAEKMFEEKANLAIENRDWDWLIEIGNQYDTYLKLIAPITTAEREGRWDGSPRKEIEFVGHNEPSRIEEHKYIMSGEHAKFCVETLHVHPVSLEKLDTKDFPTYEAFVKVYGPGTSQLHRL